MKNNALYSDQCVTLYFQEYNECVSSPCQHGGTCHDGKANYTCSCPPSYYGRHCEGELNWTRPPAAFSCYVGSATTM